MIKEAMKLRAQKKENQIKVKLLNELNFNTLRFDKKMKKKRT